MREDLVTGILEPGSFGLKASTVSTLLAARTNDPDRALRMLAETGLDATKQETLWSICGRNLRVLVDVLNAHATGIYSTVGLQDLVAGQITLEHQEIVARLADKNLGESRLSVV